MCILIIPEPQQQSTCVNWYQTRSEKCIYIKHGITLEVKYACICLNHHSSKSHIGQTGTITGANYMC